MRGVEPEIIRTQRTKPKGDNAVKREDTGLVGKPHRDGEARTRSMDTHTRKTHRARGTEKGVTRRDPKYETEDRGREKEKTG